METSRTPRYRPPHLLRPNSHQVYVDNGSKPASATTWRSNRQAHGLDLDHSRIWIRARDETTPHIWRNSETRMTTATAKISSPTSRKEFSDVQNHDNLPIEPICVGGDVVLTLKRLNPANKATSPLLRAQVSSAVLSRASVALTKAFGLAGGVMTNISKEPDISASRRGKDVNLVFSSTGSMRPLQENVRLLLGVLHWPTDNRKPLSGWAVGNILEVAWALNCQRGLVSWIEIYLYRLNDACHAESLFVRVVLSFVMGDKKAFKRSSLQYIYSHSNVHGTEDPCVRNSLGIIAFIQNDVEKYKGRYIRQLLDIIETAMISPKDCEPDIDTPLTHIIAMGALYICVSRYFGNTAFNQFTWAYSVNGLLDVFEKTEKFMTMSCVRAEDPWFMLEEGTGPGQVFGDKVRKLREEMQAGLDLNEYILNVEQFMEVDRFYIDKEKVI
ncbi:hypothetical protein L211DRAFT_892927 [Terfezia boudieri ATCC MYA-4762]|uniref:Uncharacterized protein n=1 Tax=Terfezia boudieri ATCC MYA-4762 TaxID=1051890 RepID=A0A3N4LCH9_9PEZI|nr:hypothetical protein L211DRAFT_892927 [Terfezia boudieri ATCC MYA-4762]